MSDDLRDDEISVIRRYAEQGYCHCGRRFADHEFACPPLGERACSGCEGRGRVRSIGIDPETGQHPWKACSGCGGRGW